MKKKGASYLVLGFSFLLLVVVALLIWSGRRSSGGIVLPQRPGGASGAGGGGQGSLHVVEISPQTVQTAIATLSRPGSYSRSQTVETFWSGGGGESVSRLYVSGGRTRLDTQLPDGGVRHMLFAGDLAAVWYDDETEWTVLTAQELTPDLAARTLSYEEILALPVEDIAAADYRERDGARCIYVETGPDGAGLTDRYWVDVDTGLLWAAERLQEGKVVYRFTAGTAESGTAEEGLFLLPDGSALESVDTPE